jgi:O-methyltransferase
MKGLVARLSEKRRARRRMRAAVSVGDGIFVTDRNLSFLDDQGFARGWTASVSANRAGWSGKVPDVRWRAHIALWAARHGLNLDGDFVEFGVHTALLSTTICHALDFATVAKTFYLFDTFQGIPLDGLDLDERARAEAANAHYPDVFATVSETFKAFPNVKLVKGALPGTLADANIERIAYLSIDLNTARVEHEVIMAVWDKITPGAVIVLDDYGFAGAEAQHAMWNEFSRAKRAPIATLPTGQGVMICP